MDKQQQSNEELINGYVDHIIFRNNDNGYTVMVMICDEEELTCVGVFSDIAEGDSLRSKASRKRRHRTRLRSNVILDPVQSRESVSHLRRVSCEDSRRIRSVSSRRSRNVLRKSKESAKGKQWRLRIRSMRSVICDRR